MGSTPFPSSLRTSYEKRALSTNEGLSHVLKLPDNFKILPEAQQDFYNVLGYFRTLSIKELRIKTTTTKLKPQCDFQIFIIDIPTKLKLYL